jgi:RNA polymerase sigma-70 factor (ECF subfamily)
MGADYCILRVMAESLAETFLSSLGTAAPEVDRRAVEEHLARAVDAGRAAWPDLKLAAATFAVHAGGLLGRGKHPMQALANLHGADLWLACACANSVRGAAEALERAFFPAVAKAVSGLGGSPSFTDEVRQAVREKLLFGIGGAGPAIASYSGEGPLAGWLRIAARRAALNLRSRKELPAASDDELLAAKSAMPDPEVQHLRDKYGAEFRAAFHAALAELSPQERVLLRQHYVDGLSGAKIAELRKVAPSTITRALQSARASLQAKARRNLEERLRLSASQIDSLAGLVLSKLDVSLSRALSNE